MQRAANVTSGDRVDWHSIDWKQVYATVKNLRQRIFRASRAGDLKRVRSLQRLRLRCRANVFDSVRRVTQVNQGKDTPGVDQMLVLTPEERGRLCDQLSGLDLHHVHPVRRVYIPKRKGKRPLGIPMAYSYCISSPRGLGIVLADHTRGPDRPWHPLLKAQPHEGQPRPPRRRHGS
jgi:RNA-directed DNA polymerase